MNFPPDAVRSVKLYHLPTAQGTQAYPSTPDVKTQAAVLPIDSKELALQGGLDFVEPWELYMDPSVDVRLNDKVLIAGDDANYYVRKVFKATFGILRHQRVSISRAAE